MFILDAPTRECEREEKFLSGDVFYKMQYLMNVAKMKGYSKYYTTAVKCPSMKHSSIASKTVMQCRNHLFEEISRVRPKLIIAMGKSAHQAVTDQTSVKEFRGHFSEFNMDCTRTIGGKEVVKTFTCPIMPTFSPVGSLLKWEHDIYIIHDLKKAVKYLETGIIPQTPEPKVNLILDVKALEKFKKDFTSTDALVSTDIETTGLQFFKHQILIAGYCKVGDDTVHMIPITKYTQQNMMKFDEENKKLAKKINDFIDGYSRMIVATLKEVNASNTKFIGHNLKFDTLFTRYYSIGYRNFYFDTMIADSLIDENRFHDLNSVMEFYDVNFGPYDTELWPYVNKDRAKKKSYAFVPPKLMKRYLGIDVYGVTKLYEQQQNKLRKEKMYGYMFKRSMPLARELINLEYRGHKIDKPYLLRCKESLDKEYDSIVTKIRKITKNPNLNPNSGEQISLWMTQKGFPFEKLEIKCGAKGFYSVSKDNLKKFLKFKKWKKVPKLLLRLRKISKLSSTYITNKTGTKGFIPLLDNNDFIHTNYNMHSVRTGRLASTSPNLQTVPRPTNDLPNLRQAFVPSKSDWYTWEVDKKALEIHVIALLSKDKVMIDELKRDIDMHSSNAVNFGHIWKFVDKDVDYDKFLKILKFDKPDNFKQLSKADKKAVLKKIKKAKKYKEIRTNTKAIAFGLNYGEGASALAKRFKMDEYDIQDAIDAYFNKYRGMYQWRETIKKIALEDGFLHLSTGRKRRFIYAVKWLKSKYAKQCDFKVRLLTEEIERQAMNFPVQGEATEIFNTEKLNLINALRRKKLHAYVRLTIHDGLVGDASKKHIAKVKKLCDKYMVTTRTNGKISLVLKSDFDVVTRWYGDTVKI